MAARKKTRTKNTPAKSRGLRSPTVNVKKKRGGAKGRIIVVSGASGSGKTSLCRRLLENVPAIEMSVSFTTRPERVGEVDGVHYHFVDDKKFDGMIQKKEFAEWAVVHGYRYGTSTTVLQKTIASGLDVLCDVDVQGGLALRERFGAQAILIFVIPPSMAELERRLRGRATDTPAAIRRRLTAARREHKRSRHYDYMIVNDDFVVAAGTVADIVRSERHRMGRIRPTLPGSLLK